MNEGLLMVGALLALGAVAIWYLRIAEDPSQIDKEEAESVMEESSAEANRDLASEASRPSEQEESESDFR